MNAAEPSNPNYPKGLSIILKKELLDILLRPDMLLKAVVLGPVFFVVFFF